MSEKIFIVSNLHGDTIIDAFNTIEEAQDFCESIIYTRLICAVIKGENMTFEDYTVRTAAIKVRIEPDLSDYVIPD